MYAVIAVYSGVLDDVDLHFTWKGAKRVARERAEREGQEWDDEHGRAYGKDDDDLFVAYVAFPCDHFLPSPLRRLWESLRLRVLENEIRGIVTSKEK